MTKFTAEQLAALSAKLSADDVKSRDQAGRKVFYIEGWHVIAEANRIFGFDGWSRETVDATCIWSGERSTKNGPKPAASYTARVRVTVWAGERPLVREGTGAGSGFGQDAGEAHESAVKEAETDAMKRALMTFGNPFGLALYDKSQENVERAPPAEQPPAQRAQAPAAKPSQTVRFDPESFHADALKQLAGKNVGECRAWWKQNLGVLQMLEAERTDLWMGLKNFCATAGGDVRMAG